MNFEEIMIKVNRRDFIGLSGCAGLQLTLPKVTQVALPRKEMKLDGVVFPEWASREIDDGMYRFRAWKGSDDVLSFPIVTDTHSHFIKLVDPIDWRDPRRHYMFQRKIAELARSDALLNLGDLDFDIVISGGKAPPIEEVEASREGFRKVLASERRPMLFTKGNHDSARGRWDSKVFGMFFNRGLNAANGHRIKLSDCGSWGCYDIPEKNFRIIFLNTSDEGYLGFSRGQLQFLSDHLLSAPDGWGVLIAQHANLIDFQVRWRRCLSDTCDVKRISVEQQIVEDFVNRRGGIVQGWSREARPGVFDGIRWDFSSAKANLIGVLQGHAHSESFWRFAGVNSIVRPGYGTIPSDCRCGEWRDPKRNKRGDRIFTCEKSMMIDLLAIKPTRRIAHVFRFGTGGKESELDFAY